MSSRIRFSTSHQLGQAFPALKEDLHATLNDVAPLIFAEQLLESETPEDAIIFCSYMLPKRETVWWACQCLKSLQPRLSETDQTNLNLAETWVRDPDEKNRVAALRAGMSSDKSNPSTWLALAAGWSGGNMSDNDEHPVPPPPELTAKSANAALLSALALNSVHDRGDKLSMCVKSCIRLAKGEKIGAK